MSIRPDNGLYSILLVVPPAIPYRTEQHTCARIPTRLNVDRRIHRYPAPHFSQQSADSAALDRRSDDRAHRESNLGLLKSHTW